MDRIVLVVTSVAALLVIAALAIGCGSAKKSTSTAPNSGTGKHGTSIAYVKVLPSKQKLQQGVTTIIQLKQNLAFAVGVENTGDYLEQNVKVKLVIHQNEPAQPIVKEAKIGQIFNNTTKEVIFKGPFNLTTLISMVPINVIVNPVPGEDNTANNRATYQVRFSF
ncbi:MAG: hypothetical protein ABSB96_11155 [Gaiellaceae bacterium]